PRLLARIRELVVDADRAHLVPFNTTELERDLALALGIPMYGADPKFFHYGTKTGCRRLFAEQRVRHPLGHEDLTGIDDVAEAVRRLRAERPEAAHAIVKLSEGVSGEGNATVDLRGLPAPGSADEPTTVQERVRAMTLESPAGAFDSYAADLAERGGVVEERIAGEEFRSPSVQMRV